MLVDGARGPRGSWASRVVGSLVRGKQAGMNFESSWAAAILLNPPSRREVGELQMTLYGKRDESQEDFLRRACDDAWHGRRPLLAHLPGLLGMVSDDGGTPARDGHSARPHSARVSLLA